MQASSLLSFSYGVLEAKNGTTEVSFCVIYYPNITSYPSEKVDAVSQISFFFFNWH